ncbi:MAG: hypothetical protein AB3N14_02770 [Flavobacteriaceae bacterium]
MEEKNMPTMNKKQLIRSVLLAAVIGALVLVTAVLPAEYNIDPLGTGKLFGFSRLYVSEADDAATPSPVATTPIKRKTLKIEKLGSPASVPKPSEANNPPPEEQFAMQADTILVTVPARKGVEYKFKSLKHGTTKYDWTTSDASTVYIDFHGEVFQEDPPDNVFYESYTLAYANNMAGTFTAPFEGRHGWYFRNDTNEDIIVTLRLKGQYQLFDK